MCMHCLSIISCLQNLQCKLICSCFCMQVFMKFFHIAPGIKHGSRPFLEVSGHRETEHFTVIPSLCLSFYLYFFLWPFSFCIFTGNCQQSSPTVSNQLLLQFPSSRMQLTLATLAYTHLSRKKNTLGSIYKNTFSISLPLHSVSTLAQIQVDTCMQSCAHTASVIAQQTDWH